MVKGRAAEGPGSAAPLSADRTFVVRASCLPRDCGAVVPPAWCSRNGDKGVSNAAVLFGIQYGEIVLHTASTMESCSTGRAFMG